MQRENTLAAANGRAIRTYELGGVDTPASGLQEFVQWIVNVPAQTVRLVRLEILFPMRLLKVKRLSGSAMGEVTVKVQESGNGPFFYGVVAWALELGDENEPDVILAPGADVEFDNQVEQPVQILLLAQRVHCDFRGL
ncbi:MAG: hypothetical protein HC924_17490 [Synechococcaceae cyanobacterium SM2_3_2]|nr:hypothetical protein [Synechococcaceae cyanobacterium SM2_3_2]